MKHSLMAVTVLMLLQVTSAFANHELPGGSLNRLRQDSYSLDNAVRYAPLRYQVKQAVSQFEYQVERFVRCTQGYPMQRNHDVVSEQCEYAMHDVRNSFRTVEYYLYDTYYDFPYIYQRYLAVRNDVSVLPY